MRAMPLPASTKSHWSAPRWRLCALPSAAPGGSPFPAAWERAFPRATQKPLPKRIFLRSPRAFFRSDHAARDARAAPAVGLGLVGAVVAALVDHERLAAQLAQREVR